MTTSTTYASFFHHTSSGVGTGGATGPLAPPLFEMGTKVSFGPPTFQLIPERDPFNSKIGLGTIYLLGLVQYTQQAHDVENTLAFNCVFVATSDNVMATSDRRQNPTSYLSQIFDVELRLLIDWKWSVFWRRVLTKIRRRGLVMIWLKMKVFLTSCSD